MGNESVYVRCPYDSQWHPFNATSRLQQATAAWVDSNNNSTITKGSLQQLQQQLCCFAGQYQLQLSVNRSAHQHMFGCSPCRLSCPWLRVATLAPAVITAEYSGGHNSGTHYSGTIHSPAGNNTMMLLHQQQHRMMGLTVPVVAVNPLLPTDLRRPQQCQGPQTALTAHCRR